VIGHVLGLQEWDNRMSKTILLILMAAQVASAQTTWKGLRFGMSEADVRKEYSASLEKETTEDGEFQLSDANQELFGSRAMALFFFDRNGKLSQIELFMKDPFADKAGTGATGSSLALISEMPKKLIEKYGVSVSQKGECDLAAEDIFENPPTKIFTCDKLWRSDGQTIDMYWSVGNQRVAFFAITYKPLPSDI
jgi:hypothetical protein